MSTPTPDITPIETARKPPVPLWRNRDYLLLWSGQAISNIGGSISQLAFPLLVLAITHSPAQMGFAVALTTLPRPLFNLVAGALVDRWDRKRVMLVCEVGRALCLASIPVAFLLGYLTVVQLYLVAFTAGTLAVFFDLAQTACLPRVVAQEQLGAAVAQEEVMEGTTALFGPALSGFLFSISQTFPFLADAVSYVASILTLFFIRTSFQEQRTRQRRRLHKEMIEGFVWLWRLPFLRDTVILNAAFAFAFAGQVQFVIVLAQQQHATATVIGLIFTCGGVGAILGSLLAPRVEKLLSIGHTLLAVRWIFVLLWFFYALLPGPWLLGAIDFGYGLADPIEDVAYFSYRHELIPDELKGRVISVCRQFPQTFRPIGAALTGILLQRYGAMPTALIFWAMFLLMMSIATLNPNIRKARR
jgi:MFS family permease